MIKALLCQTLSYLELQVVLRCCFRSDHGSASCPDQVKPIIAPAIRRPNPSTASEPIRGTRRAPVSGAARGGEADHMTMTRVPTLTRE